MRSFALVLNYLPIPVPIQYHPQSLLLSFLQDLQMVEWIAQDSFLICRYEQGVHVMTLILERNERDSSLEVLKSPC